MNNLVKFSIRVLAVAAAVAFIAVFSANTSPASNPYLSALSDLTLGSAAHAAPCDNTVCTLPHSTCGFTSGFKCFFHQGQCDQKPCP